MHIDQNTDPTFALLNDIIKERPGFSDMVKTAQVGLDVREELPLTAFADPHNRLFPVHTPEDAALSKAYSEKQAGVPVQVSEAIEAALGMYGVEVPEPQVSKTAFAKVAYLLEDTRQLPIREDTDVAKAEAALHRNSRKLAPKTLAKAANILIKEASDRGLEVSSDTLRFAGLTQCDRDKAAESIEIRGEAAPKGREYFDKLAGYVRALPSGSTRSDLVTIADAVGKLDTNYGLAKHYGRSLPNPMETVFNTKVAMGPSLDLAGTDVPLEELLRVDPEAYSDILGPDVLGEITGPQGELDPENVSAIFATLPLDMKRMLVSKLGL